MLKVAKVLLKTPSRDPLVKSLDEKILVRATQ